MFYLLSDYREGGGGVRRGSDFSQQGPSASAYVTYFKSEDALRAIQAVNNIFIGDHPKLFSIFHLTPPDGRTLKASLGTTKYCSHFMKNQTCPKNDCMYLHELGEHGNGVVSAVQFAKKCSALLCALL